VKDAGPEWMADMCSAVAKDGKIPEDWSESQLASVYKGKGNALECSLYRDIKVLEHVLKIFDKNF